MVLSVEWRSDATPSNHLGDQVIFWSRVFGGRVRPRYMRRSPSRRGTVGLVQNIAVDEIFSALQKTKCGAVKLDLWALQEHFRRSRIPP